MTLLYTNHARYLDIYTLLKDFWEYETYGANVTMHHTLT